MRAWRITDAAPLSGSGSDPPVGCALSSVRRQGIESRHGQVPGRGYPHRKTNLLLEVNSGRVSIVRLLDGCERFQLQPVKFHPLIPFVSGQQNRAGAPRFVACSSLGVDSAASPREIGGRVDVREHARILASQPPHVLRHDRAGSPGRRHPRQRTNAASKYARPKPTGCPRAHETRARPASWLVDGGGDSGDGRRLNEGHVGQGDDPGGCLRVLAHRPGEAGAPGRLAPGGRSSRKAVPRQQSASSGSWD